MTFGSSASRFLSTTTGWHVQLPRPLNDVDLPAEFPDALTPAFAEGEQKQLQWNAFLENVALDLGSLTAVIDECCWIHHASRNCRSEAWQEPLIEARQEPLMMVCGSFQFQLKKKR
ncbi:MAG TPA: hypothetical protein VFL97_08965 [Nitrococcus sp.]|nr:hypothetical protein [Nitrococcus sp.]